MIEVFHTTEFMNNEKPYELVAEFSHSDRGRAYHDTQNLDESWSLEPKRSTSSGDVSLFLINEPFDIKVVDPNRLTKSVVNSIAVNTIA